MRSPQRLVRLVNADPTGDSRSTFAGGAAGAFVARVLRAVLILAAYLLAVRGAGEAEYGRYIYLYNWAAIISLVATLGLDLAALRFVAALTEARRWSELRGFVQRAPGIVLASTVTMAALISGCAWLFRRALPTGLVAPLLVACALLPLISLLQMYGFMIRGQKRALASVVPESVLRPLLLIGLIGSAWAAWPGAITAVWLLLCDAVATGVALVFAIALLRRGRPPEALRAPARFELATWLSTGLPLAVQAAVRLSMNRADIIMVGMLVSPTAAGVYALASQISALIAFPLMAANTIAAPLFAELHAARKKTELQRLVTFATRSVTAGAAAIGLLAILLSPWVLRLFGEAFQDAYLPFVVLAAGQLVNAASGSVGFLLGMSGDERYAARVTLAMGALNLLLNAAMIPLLGLLGAALATAASGVLWNVLLVRRIHVALGIQPTVLGRHRGR